MLFDLEGREVLLHEVEPLSHLPRAVGQQTGCGVSAHAAGVKLSLLLSLLLPAAVSVGAEKPHKRSPVQPLSPRPAISLSSATLRSPCGTAPRPPPFCP